MDMTEQPAFPKKLLADSFEAIGLREAQVGDGILSWPVKYDGMPVLTILQDDEQRERLIQDNLSNSTLSGAKQENTERAKVRHCAIRAKADTPLAFLQAWMTLPGNVQAMHKRAREGRYFANAREMTKDALYIMAPAPTAEQILELDKGLTIMKHVNELIENKRRLVDTQEKMVHATLHKMLSGQLNLKQVAALTRMAWYPETEAAEVMRRSLTEGSTSHPVTDAPAAPAPKPRSGP